MGTEKGRPALSRRAGARSWSNKRKRLGEPVFLFLRENWTCPRNARTVLISKERCMSNGRDIRKGDARIGAGLESSFSSFVETSLLVLNVSCERGIEGRLQSEPMGG